MEVNVTFAVARCAMSQMIWKHDERMIVYPAYVDNTRTVAEGRKVGKEHAVARPHVVELKDACERALGLECEIEDKTYSRDIWQRGRLRVTWKREDGGVVKEEYGTRGKVLRALGKAVARSERRMANLGAADDRVMSAEQMLEKYLSEVAAQGPAAPGMGKKALASAAAAKEGGSAKKKKGKK